LMDRVVIDCVARFDADALQPFSTPNRTTPAAADLRRGHAKRRRRFGARMRRSCLPPIRRRLGRQVRGCRLSRPPRWAASHDQRRRRALAAGIAREPSPRTCIRSRTRTLAPRTFALAPSCYRPPEPRQRFTSRQSVGFHRTHRAERQPLWPVRVRAAGRRCSSYPPLFRPSDRHRSTRRTSDISLSRPLVNDLRPLTSSLAVNGSSSNAAGSADFSCRGRRRMGSGMRRLFPRRTAQRRLPEGRVEAGTRKLWRFGAEVFGEAGSSVGG